MLSNTSNNQLDVWYLKPNTATVPVPAFAGGGFMSLVPLTDYKLIGPC